MTIPEQSVEEALERANRLSSANWQWLRYAADSDVLLLGYYARSECLAFHRPRYVRLPRDLVRPTLRLSDAAADHGGFRDAAPDDIVVAIRTQEREYGVVCRGVTFVDEKEAFPGRHERSILRGVDLREADLGAADLRRAELREADLSGADLRYADLSGANLHGARLDGAKLCFAVLDRTDLRDASLRDADLSFIRGFDARRDVDLSGSDLSGATLRRLGLERSHMVAARFVDADLRRASLDRVDLRDADLRRADLREARFYGVNLREADLSDADLTGIQYDRKTRWPKGFRPPPSSFYDPLRPADHRVNLARLEEINGATLRWWALELTHGTFRLQVLGAPAGSLEVHCTGTGYLDLPAQMTNARMRQAGPEQIQAIRARLPDGFRWHMADAEYIEEFSKWPEDERPHLQFEPVIVDCDEGQFVIVAWEFRLQPLEETYTLWLEGRNRLLWHLCRRQV